MFLNPNFYTLSDIILTILQILYQKGCNISKKFSTFAVESF